ncbi:MAG: S8 family peptidase [Ferruginibacter sp.]
MKEQEKNTGASNSPLPESNPGDFQFTPEVMDRTIIAIPLLKDMKQEGDAILAIQDKIKKSEEKGEVPPALPAPVLYDIVIDLHLSFKDEKRKAKDRVIEMMGLLKEKYPYPPGAFINTVKSNISRQYVFARLTAQMIRELVHMDKLNDDKDLSKLLTKRAIYRIWPDFEVKSFITKSISTVKADAARSSFSAFGDDITWAVIDSGIDKSHPHFKEHNNIEEVFSRDFTAVNEKEEVPFDDTFGHGTHVAGIIAGEMKSEEGFSTVIRHRDESGIVVYETRQEKAISGMAPRCKLVSLKVLDSEGKGLASNLIVAIEYIQEINGYGRDLKIHGVNMSLGYDFDPEWFACGQSPLCVEVNRLVKSGVVVVAAAGNTGYGYVKSAFRNVVTSGMMLSINDPGNAELAITVGSTHKDMPHTYGVSYFSSKGPTGDGRKKPDLLAPGEKIISCAAGNKKKIAEEKNGVNTCLYIEDSGTSMAAPHVSGVIAAFLSIRREYKGRPDLVKQIFLSTATDLNRDAYFQGHGLIDLMRAIQSV